MALSFPRRQASTSGMNSVPRKKDGSASLCRVFEPRPKRLRLAGPSGFAHIRTIAQVRASLQSRHTDLIFSLHSAHAYGQGLHVTSCREVLAHSHWLTAPPSLDRLRGLAIAAPPQPAVHRPASPGLRPGLAGPVVRAIHGTSCASHMSSLPGGSEGPYTCIRFPGVD